MRWWWFGPTVTKPELAREMRNMKEGGIGGFEVQPVYPLALDDPELGFKNVPYLSDEYQWSPIGRSGRARTSQTALLWACRASTSSTTCVITRMPPWLFQAGQYPNGWLTIWR
jgi:hypothetical protein